MFSGGGEQEGVERGPPFHHGPHVRRTCLQPLLGEGQAPEHPPHPPVLRVGRGDAGERRGHGSPALYRRAHRARQPGSLARPLALHVPAGVVLPSKPPLVSGGSRHVYRARSEAFAEGRFGQPVLLLARQRGPEPEGPPFAPHPGVRRKRVPGGPRRGEREPEARMTTTAHARGCALLPATPSRRPRRCSHACVSLCSSPVRGPSIFQAPGHWQPCRAAAVPVRVRWQ